MERWPGFASIFQFSRMCWTDVAMLGAVCDICRGTLYGVYRKANARE